MKLSLKQKHFAVQKELISLVPSRIIFNQNSPETISRISFTPNAFKKFTAAIQNYFTELFELSEDQLKEDGN